LNSITTVKDCGNTALLAQKKIPKKKEGRKEEEKKQAEQGSKGRKRRDRFSRMREGS